MIRCSPTPKLTALSKALLPGILCLGLSPMSVTASAATANEIDVVSSLATQISSASADGPLSRRRPVQFTSLAAGAVPTLKASHLFEFLEAEFPLLFPKGPATVSTAISGVQLEARVYITTTGTNVAGLSGGQVYGRGAFTGEALTSFGHLQDFAAIVCKRVQCDEPDGDGLRGALAWRLKLSQESASSPSLPAETAMMKALLDDGLPVPGQAIGARWANSRKAIASEALKTSGNAAAVLALTVRRLSTDIEPDVGRERAAAAGQAAMISLLGTPSPVASKTADVAAFEMPHRLASLQVSLHAACNLSAAATAACDGAFKSVGVSVSARWSQICDGSAKAPQGCDVIANLPTTPQQLTAAIKKVANEAVVATEACASGAKTCPPDKDPAGKPVHDRQWYGNRLWEISDSVARWGVRAHLISQDDAAEIVAAGVASRSVFFAAGSVFDAVSKFKDIQWDKALSISSMVKGFFFREEGNASTAAVDIITGIFNSTHTLVKAARAVFGLVAGGSSGKSDAAAAQAQALSEQIAAMQRTLVGRMDMISTQLQTLLTETRQGFDALQNGQLSLERRQDAALRAMAKIDSNLAELRLSTAAAFQAISIEGLATRVTAPSIVIRDLSVWLEQLAAAYQWALISPSSQLHAPDANTPDALLTALQLGGWGHVNALNSMPTTLFGKARYLDQKVPSLGALLRVADFMLAMLEQAQYRDFVKAEQSTVSSFLVGVLAEIDRARALELAIQARPEVLEALAAAYKEQLVKMSAALETDRANVMKLAGPNASDLSSFDAFGNASQRPASYVPPFARDGMPHCDGIAAGQTIAMPDLSRILPDGSAIVAAGALGVAQVRICWRVLDSVYNGFPEWTVLRVSDALKLGVGAFNLAVEITVDGKTAVTRKMRIPETGTMCVVAGSKSATSNWTNSIPAASIVPAVWAGSYTSFRNECAHLGFVVLPSQKTVFEAKSQLSANWATSAPAAVNALNANVEAALARLRTRVLANNAEQLTLVGTPAGAAARRLDVLGLTLVRLVETGMPSFTTSDGWSALVNGKDRLPASGEIAGLFDAAAASGTATGAPEFVAGASSKVEALRALVAAHMQRIARGEIVEENPDQAALRTRLQLIRDSAGFRPAAAASRQ